MADTVIKADDAQINYVGRILKEDGTVRFDWSGVTAKIKFTGTKLTMDVSDSHANFLNVWIDSPATVRAHKVVRTAGESTITLADGLKKGTHEVTVQKRTEGEQGTVTIKTFTTDGKFAKASAERKRLIEFIGDSYTCGYGTEGANRDEHFKVETENCNLSYAAIIGRFFDADIRLISHSGRGIVRNYGGADCETVPQLYKRTFDDHPTPLWTPDGRVPDMVVIYLGTNDFSCGEQPLLFLWTDAYVGLIKNIREFYGPDVPVLMVASDANILIEDYVRHAALATGDPKVAWTAIHQHIHDIDTDYGSDWHPNYSGHRKVASCMVPYIATLTGWELPIKTLE